MRKLAAMSGAKNPQQLRGTAPKKQLAVSLQYANLSAEDMRQVAATLGHTVETHMAYYRLPIPSAHLGKVSKVLMAIDEGSIEKFKAKTLLEIDYSPYAESLLESEEEEVTAPPVSPVSTPPLSPSPSFRGGTPGSKRTYKPRVQGRKIRWATKLKESIKKEFESEIQLLKLPNLQ